MEFILRLGLLELISQRLSEFSNIQYIKRVDNNTLKLAFDNTNTFFIDLTKGNSSIYKKKGFEHNKEFNAPFDILLSKRFGNAKIERVYLHNGDKILRIVVLASNSYKKMRTILQLEFTGKHTNAIILDEDNRVLEALRHISEHLSSRIVKVGSVLQELPKREFDKKEFVLEDSLDTYLLCQYEIMQKQRVQTQKNQKLMQLSKQKEELNTKISQLQDKDALLALANEHYEKANILLAHIDTVKPYQEEVSLIDFQGNSIVIQLQKDKSVAQSIDAIFATGKKLKQKALSCHIEKENIMAKISHLEAMIRLVNNASCIDELEFYFPKKEKNQKITKKLEPYQSFFVLGYKIMIGRSAKENEWLLKNARADDFWFHLKDRPSAHAFVATNKKELPLKVIIEAASLCAKLSCEFGGGYEVDYTQRRNVKVQNGSNVTYTEYKTIFVKI